MRVFSSVNQLHSSFSTSLFSRPSSATPEGLRLVLDPMTHSTTRRTQPRPRALTAVSPLTLETNIFICPFSCLPPLGILVFLTLGSCMYNFSVRPRSSVVSFFSVCMRGGWEFSARTMLSCTQAFHDNPHTYIYTAVPATKKFVTCIFPPVVRLGPKVVTLFASKWHVDMSVPASVNVISSVSFNSQMKRVMYTVSLVLTKEYSRLQAPLTQ